MTVRSRLAAGAVALALAAPPAAAAVVDLDYLFSTTFGGGIGPDGILVQTFRPTISGDLTRLDLQLYAAGIDPGNSGAEATIVSSTGGVPDIAFDPVSDVLTLGALGAASRGPLAPGSGLDGFDVQGGAFAPFDFSGAGVHLDAGVLYTIVLRQTDTTHGTLLWNYEPSGGYADGQAGTLNLASATATGPTYNDDIDYSFRTHMTPVPLPAGLPMLLSALGLGALLAATRRATR